MTYEEYVCDEAAELRAEQEFEKRYYARLADHPDTQDPDYPEPPAGYTADGLDRDNPYNQWMN